MNAKKPKGNYAQLKKEMMIQIVSMAVGAVVFIGLLYFVVWAGRGADFMVSVLQIFFGYDTALSIYNNVFRSNAEIIIVVSLVLAFLAFLYIFVSNFTRYFNEINSGIDALLQEEDEEIKLSEGMKPIEDKLNTVRKNLRTSAEQAREAEQRKNDLVMYLAHDIRTPLTSVIGYLSLLNEEPNMPTEQRANYTHITLEKAFRLEKLVNEFFEVTRYAFQADALVKENIDLPYMLAQMADEFFPLLSTDKKEIKIHSASDITICGDPDKLARVFNNILKNAVAYSPSGSVIDITTNVKNNAVTIVFTNDGSIPQSELVSIFDKFYRLDAARSTKTGGAGLGLAIAKEIVMSHGGDIFAESDEKRTSFIVKLPMA